ncbi:MAG: hypothetical protein K6B43_03795 [Treponema sp.]|nr:hypothetical protein [Treponema sp.]
MKKVLRNIVCGLAAVNLIALAASCSDGLDDDDPFVKNGVVTTNGGNNASGNGDTPADNGGTATSGSFDMPENQYDKGNTQYKGPTGIASLAVGDKVKMTFKGKASKTFKGEFFIVDTTAAAEYWFEIADKYEVAEVPVDFTIEHTFEITKAPKGTGSESTYFAVVGKDDATTIHIDYTELKFEKLGGSSSSGDAGNQQNNGTGENQQTTGGETTEPTTGENTPAATDDHGLLDASVDLTWDGGATVAASKLASATDTSKFVVTYTANTDTDYHTFKMRVVSPEQELYEGTATGITINTTATSANDLHGCSFVTAPAATANTFSYQPSAAEWTALKAGGFNIYGHGAKITKIVLEAGTSGEVNAEGTGGAAANQDATTVTPYSTTNLTVTTVNNAYSTSTHGIQAKVTVRVGDALKGLSKGDTFVVKMKGTASKAFAPQVYFMDNTSAGGYANLGAWGDTVNFETEFDISKEVTISEKAPTSDDADAFVFVIDYDESSATADLENVTFNFSEFSVTKK